MGEAFVADCEHFVHEQDVRIDVNRHREPETHVHPGRVRLHRRVDEFLELGELDDLVEAARDLLLGQAEHDPVDEDVLAAGDLGVKAGAELDERRDAAVDLDRPVVGFVIPATSLSIVLLPEPFRPITPSVRPAGTVKDTSLQRRERLVRLQIAHRGSATAARS